MQGKGLQQERADHEAETQEPDAAAHGVRHEAQAHGGLLRGVLDAHALKHAGQRVAKCRSYCKDIDHRLAANVNWRSSHSTQWAHSGRTGSVHCAKQRAVTRKSCASSARRTESNPSSAAFPQKFSVRCPIQNVAVRLRLRHLPPTLGGWWKGGRPSPGRPAEKGVPWDCRGSSASLVQATAGHPSRAGGAMRLVRTLGVATVAFTTMALMLVSTAPVRAPVPRRPAGRR